jgi:TfoX/Sxy family transcriptional regulator of competence genes
MAADDDNMVWLGIRERLLAADPEIELKHAFSSPGLRYRDKIFAMYVRGELVVKLPAERCEQLDADGHARPFRVGQRVMREWTVVGTDRELDWDALADEALAYARAVAA